MADADKCIFCRIIRGEIPGRIIGQDAEVVVLLSLENHPLILTRDHVPDVFSLRDAQGAAVMKAARTIAIAMRDALKPDGLYLGQANGAAAGQEVFHYHLHLYPRWNDGRKVTTDESSMETTFQSIRDALAKVPRN
jgi:histidine triad (HIT) family protein